jgi:hypothetical protein
LNFDEVKIDIIPWICPDNEVEITNFISKSKSDFCIGHFELAGFEMDRGNICTDGWNADQLKRYEMVMSGHFHHKSKIGNVLYVGSPYEMSWADYNDPRGFHIFDTATRELEFVVNPHSIFSKIYYNDEDTDYKADDETLKKYSGKYVKVVVVKKTNAFMFDSWIDALMKIGPVDLSVVEDFTEIDMITDGTTDVDQADDTVTIIDKVIDNIEIDLNKSKLKTIMREIYTEALVVE